MNQNTVTGDYININLRQLGATSIKEFNSIMHIAEFDLGDGLIVSYVFNIHEIAARQIQQNYIISPERSNHSFQNR